ncbi:RNA polymerase sigma factor, sigma-70 family [Halobacillus dabanensis]|uniref:RNA polymerase sigma factor, sigma-70 family n=1 Tax=Halobacillus dabanensis TaxID=240302 RepID=A0A1I3XCL6_HALDA|nr:sigma-70 family RNA polymerase sigma factor [Halobacillus dabanensis]SFK17275.1 RNA polymerase sigma factor, sigma-70 family [Halobacillus dabanensis]
MKNSLPPFADCERLVYFTLNLLNIPEPHDDYFQESYLVYNRCLEKYDGTLSKFSTYYIQRLYHHFQTQHRNEQREREASFLLSIQHTPSDSDPLHESLLLFDIHHHTMLDSRERLIFDHSYSGHTVNEVAQLMKTSPSTVKRVRKCIKLKLEKLQCLPNP